MIPLLSGHVGGAVSLADEIAELLGAVSIHTTATDVQGKFAVECNLPKRTGLVITDLGGCKEYIGGSAERRKDCILYRKDRTGRFG